MNIAKGMCTVMLCAVLFSGALIETTNAVTPNVPRFITYQGRMTDLTGTPLPDGPKSVRIIVWRDATSTNPLDEVWNSGPLTVTTDKGLFTVRLGEPPQPIIDPYDFLDTARWIGVTIGADPEMSPRTRLGAVPYAWTAGSAQIALTTYDGGVGSAQIAEGSVDNADLAAGAVQSGTIQDGSVQLIDLDPASLPAVGQIPLSGSGSSFSPFTLTQFTVIAPGPGYLDVSVIGQYWLDADATSASSLYAFFFMELNTLPAILSEFIDFDYVDPDNANAANSTHSFTLNNVYYVASPGPNVFYVNAQNSAALYNIYLYSGTRAVVRFFPATLPVSSPVAPEPASQRSDQ